MFIDKALVQVTAGKGGNGKVSLLHEKYIEKGGPDGGDGGHGGNVIFRADKNVNTLARFRYKQELKAEDGEAGGKRRMHGKNGKDRVVEVPVGTIIYHDEKEIADLAKDGQEVIVAQGGRGGFGNAHFKSSTRQTPRVAEVGEKGDEFEARLELKLLADVGLIGFPNAGKSTFLSVVTNATPEIGDYAFTTLTPNLGVADIDDESILIADIPGLIEGASEGKGLGDAFLKHVERTAVLLHLVDAYSDQPAEDYETIRRELAAYSPELARRSEVVALTKIEGVPPETVAAHVAALKAVTHAPVFAISSLARTQLDTLLRQLARLVQESRAAQSTLEEEMDEAEIPLITLSGVEREAAYHVSKEEQNYLVTGEKVERFAARTDYTNPHSVNRLRDIMKKMGIMHELMRQGAESADVVVIGETGEYRLRLDEE